MPPMQLVAIVFAGVDEGGACGCFVAEERLAATQALRELQDEEALADGTPAGQENHRLSRENVLDDPFPERRLATFKVGNVDDRKRRRLCGHCLRWLMQRRLVQHGPHPVGKQYSCRPPQEVGGVLTFRRRAPSADFAASLMPPRRTTLRSSQAGGVVVGDDGERLDPARTGKAARLPASRALQIGVKPRAALRQVSIPSPIAKPSRTSSSGHSRTTAPALGSPPNSRRGFSIGAFWPGLIGSIQV